MGSETADFYMLPDDVLAIIVALFARNNSLAETMQLSRVDKNFAKLIEDNFRKTFNEENIKYKINSNTIFFAKKYTVAKDNYRKGFTPYEDEKQQIEYRKMHSESNLSKIERGVDRFLGGYRIAVHILTMRISA